ncbi:NAD(+)--rifampin ADP-ribosyltransferase [Rubellimicrobium roseum]|uniref:NAD(+)--rifampin ADP-ribosyltransferase n=1 Tax=Rubellimicrobium roseum TaxID=687525 RepID=UPI001C3F2431
MIAASHRSNFGAGKPNSQVYLAATLEAAVWVAETAQGSGREGLYVVGLTISIEGDPNPTDKNFPGNPMGSFRSREPLRVVAGVAV